MQAELVYRKPLTMMTTTSSQSFHRPGTGRKENSGRDSRETIHSGHFMVSDFEAEAQDDEDELAVPVPDEEAAKIAIIASTGFLQEKFATSSSNDKTSQQLSIETSLNKLFQCMSLAYRQKLTSPKWNRFKGIRLRWKDKIRLNNVIWRCWHMQFILKQNTLVCQFASPLDVDTHNKPEAVVLEGKYWKRKLAAVTAEYKKWRMFYRNKILGWTNKDGTEMKMAVSFQMESMDVLDWGNGLGISGNYGAGTGSTHGGTSGTPGGESMMVDEDYMELMTDTLFSTISSNQPIYFPDPREIARGASLADFIQPSLGPLQPNLDDFMDTLEPLQEFLNSKLPPVPEEDDMFRNSTLNTNYPDLDLMTPMNQINELSQESAAKNEQASQQPALAQNEQGGTIQNLQYTAKIYTQPQPEPTNAFRNNITLSENYSTIQQSYEPAATSQPVREKSRPSRVSSRNSRVIQQPQQQRTSTYQRTAQQQNSAYQQQQASQQQPYAMEIQSVQLTPVQNQVQMPALNDQSAHANQIPPIAAHVQNLVTVQQTFGQTNSTVSTQHRSIRPLPPVAPISSKPYKVVQPQQCYKFPTLPQNFNAQQCKFNTNNFKTHPPQQVVSVSTEQPSQSPILLQCRPSGLDLTTPTVQPTKLLPQPAASNSEKEEVFAVPKYQMKARNRSRSSSSLTASRIHPPPLVSAASDPALNLNNNVLLAQLLTNTSPTQVTTTHHITTPVTVQTMQTSTIQVQPQQQAMQQTTCSQQMLLNTNTQAHQSQNSPGSPKDSSNAHSPQGLNLSPLHSPMSIGSPLSPSRGYIKGESERGQYKEQRRVGHIHAEQKRRYNIKNGFDMLHSLIPQLNQNPNTKMSKAAMLQKGADYIRQLRAERNQLKEEMDTLRHQIECLNTSISNCQSMLPATGAPISRHRTSKMKEMFDEYVRTRTRENWKFWIFSVLLEPLMISFNTSVSTASIEDLYRSTILWVEQHCSLVDLRPAVLNSLRYLCTATDILSDPGRLPEEALAAVNRTERRRSTQ
ncbi:MLX interacting protein mondo isoform X3 [Bombus vancouverensis nearcticus]|uniref:Carbohydrate-responsive element-binding protein isoform X3 n=1 Tax=Bombus bifarius TaxID=103933 RepID=A0A6P8LS35_9HYME|nr:carbohydrate-responsive element-binding protein isoform X3 [Bombus vancouverensis nearcticus]XP_033301074.1 carbohydrate-responsive element-binding protein isoform X3 [Bombus bifarius]